MRFIIAFTLLVAPLCAGCSIPRSAGDLREAAQARQFIFSKSPTLVKACLLPELDRLKPFSADQWTTNPPTTREIGSKTEIISQDSTLMLYLLDVEPLQNSTAVSLFARTPQLEAQVSDALKNCGGIFK